MLLLVVSVIDLPRVLACKCTASQKPLVQKCEPSIHFDHDLAARLPTASTYDMTLYLPAALSSSYDLFKEHMSFSISNSKSFGSV